ncbi:hypothetical protein [Halalkalirubrum salinum]|uniref:hypothetical protein n=1 Tax=Halalkalirubrum salinum TaxID=2563889 RepID=UPI0010FB3361|nr:hypothetical protein [Halalkalirubrum salinum]
MERSRTDATAAGLLSAIADRGWTLEDGPRRGPAAIGRPPTGGSTAVSEERSTLTTGPVAIEPVAPADADPTTIISRVVHADRHDRNILFLTGSDEVAEQIEAIVSDPPLVRSSRSGLRTFYAGPDRIPIEAGGYALVKSPQESLRWRETRTPAGPVAGDPTGTRGPRVVIEIDDTVRAVVADANALASPPPEAFPYRYQRDPDTKRFYVFSTRDGPTGPIEDYPGVKAIRAGGYTPVPMPIVPEHLFEGETPAIGIYSIERDRITIAEPRT